MEFKADPSKKYGMDMPVIRKRCFACEAEIARNKRLKIKEKDPVQYALILERARERAARRYAQMTPKEKAMALKRSNAKRRVRRAAKRSASANGNPS